MFSDSSFMRTQNMLERGLNVSLKRRASIADNIANVDVPNFKRSEVLFEGMLHRTLQAEATYKRDEVPFRLTDKRHIPLDRPPNWQNVQPKKNIDYLTTMRSDGNNVDLEKELTLAAENQLRYNVMIQQLNGNFRKLNIVMRPS